MYRNGGALPRAFIVLGWAVAGNIERELVMRKDPRRLNPATTVILERQFAEIRGNLPDPVMPVPIVLPIFRLCGCVTHFLRHGSRSRVDFLKALSLVFLFLVLTAGEWTRQSVFFSSPLVRDFSLRASGSLRL